MFDILAHVDVEVSCSACAEQYQIPVSTVLESQRLIAAGCPGTSIHECPPRFYASLVDPDALAELTAAWSHVEQSARASGNARLVLDAGGATDVPPAQNVALSRWEDDGGAGSFG